MQKNRVLLTTRKKEVLCMLRFGRQISYINRSSTHRMSLDLTPPINRTMTVLDRSFFERRIPLVYAHFTDPKLVGQFTKSCAADILVIKKVKNVLKLGDDRGVLLTERLSDPESAESVLLPETLDFLRQHDVPLKPHELVIDYDFWRSDEILGAILPEEFIDEVPSGFTITGHIAHLNLREEFKPFGKLIGHVILDKNPNIRTVVNKLDSIHTVYRTFAMEVLAGEDDMVVEQRESNCLFKFDFSKVYWNSRLHTEHERLVHQFAEGSLVCDVMAGVGPFSVPAGKKRVFVMSNDLNPESVKYMKENINRNKASEFVDALHVDGRILIQQVVKYCREFSAKRGDVVKVHKRRKIGRDQPAVVETKEFRVPQFVSHFVMNLPDSALDFVQEYVGIYSSYSEIQDVPGFQLPFVHVYCFEKFSPDETPEPTEKQLHHRVFDKVVASLQTTELKFEDVHFHTVRKVAPTKPMFRVSFQLPHEVAFRK